VIPRCLNPLRLLLYIWLYNLLYMINILTFNINKLHKFYNHFVGLRLRHLHLPKQMMGPYGALFFFCFQRGLAVATALRRLEKSRKLVSEPALSLTDRPRCSEGRIQKELRFQCVDVFEQAPFSKFQLVAKYDANPQGGGVKAIGFWLPNSLQH
jgi:hypothetical protein